jgi:hypothetical protein
MSQIPGRAPSGGKFTYNSKEKLTKLWKFYFEKTKEISCLCKNQVQEK